MDKKNLVLVADDDKRHREMLCALLDEWGYEVASAVDGQQAVDFSKKGLPDLALLDVRMPKKGGLTAFSEIHAARKDLPVLIMTAYSDIPAAVEAIKAGAHDYLSKPLDFDRLKICLANVFALKNAPKAREEAKIGKKGEILGESAPILELQEMIRTIAPTSATVLITGESGVGKELVARAVHKDSGRKGDFVAVNCGAFTDTLLASELFGHEKGAFTGADKKHEGLFVKASGGTIFLDEVGEMSPAMQVKLLRVLQEKEVLSVGSAKPVSVDARVIAATNRDLAKEVEEGRFREDLYYRLNVVSITPPPLRDRGNDIALLAMNFAKRFAAANRKNFSGIEDGAMRKLLAWQWPGNVRELENVMERAIIMMTGETITERQLPERLLAASPRQATDTCLATCEDGVPTLDEVERAVILRTLERFGNNKTETAKALGITRKTLHAKLARYKMED